MKRALQKRLVLGHDTVRMLAELPEARLQDVVGGMILGGGPTQPPVCPSTAQKTGLP
jgi:hypothetical protein